jgi:phosphoribosylformylglycinamidine synthase
MARACTRLGVPIVSGNVSLYNETDKKGVLPTPSVAMVGLVDGPLKPIRSRFGRAGLDVVVLGKPPTHGVGASSWMSWLWGLDKGAPPPVDEGGEKLLHDAVIRLVRDGVVEVAHDVGEGGLAVALAECCTGLRGDAPVGLVGVLPEGQGSVAARLFGEDHGRVIVAFDPKRWDAVTTIAGKVPVTRIGLTGGDRLVLRGVLDLFVSAIQTRWEGGLPDYMAGGSAWKRGARTR